MSEAGNVEQAGLRWYLRSESLFGLLLFAGAALALAIVTSRASMPPTVGWTQDAFFLIFSLFTISIGYPHPSFGYVSFDRVAQVSSIVVLGPLQAAWIAAVASIIYPWHRLRHGVPLAKVLDAAITNAGLMTLVVLGAGGLYRWLGGPVPLRSLDPQTFVLLIGLILAMQFFNELGMACIYYFRSHNPLQVISLFETLTELLSGLTAILVAIVYTRMELEVFVLLLLVIAAGMLGLKQFADMRRQLEQLVAMRTEALKEKSEQLEQLATRDTLTGLRNRRFAEEFLGNKLDEAQRYGQELTVALADIDHFKEINDGYSHATGDKVLQAIGRIFDERIRSTDLIARYGGEEFLFCFTGTGEDMAAQVCEDLRRTVEAHDWSQVTPGLAVTISIGLIGRSSGSGVQDIVAAADARLYRAKHTGRNLVVAESTVTQPAL